MHSIIERTLRKIAIIGNPNSGKSTIFNSLTGLRQKVANYPGVTVEKKEGRVNFKDGSYATLIDLPGTYSLTANAPDEKIVKDILLGRQTNIEPFDLIICVVDASNLERNLYLVSQIIDLKLPVIMAFNMIDVAEKSGILIDIKKLSEELGIIIIPTIGSKRVGIEALKNAVNKPAGASPKARQWKLPTILEEECIELKNLLQIHSWTESNAFHDSITLLSSPFYLEEQRDFLPEEIIRHVSQDYNRLNLLGMDCQSEIVEARYEWIKAVCGKAVILNKHNKKSMSDKVDNIMTHKFWGFIIFLSIMTVIFQAVFTWAVLPMNLITAGFDYLGISISQVLPKGELQDLIVNGALAGVSAVVTFLPQILFLFFFIALLEDTGYMARAAFIMDRLMSKVGLHGKSFIPMLSSFACAIPGIMSTRTIESKKDRLVTMLVSPLMSCSARLPIYALMIAAFIPHKAILGIFSLPGITLVAMYLLGLFAALGMAWLFKKTLLKSETPVFIMELPPYKLPSLKSILLQMWERGSLFLKRAGTIILGVSIILWFLSSYPKMEKVSPSEQLEHSFVGRIGHIVEPLIRPLGFDWKIGIGLISSMLQREVFVSTMGTIYNVKDSGKGEGTISLSQHMKEDINPASGLPVFSALTAICLMVYYVLAMQCMSTIAVMKRETNGWKWPLFQFGYMTALAYSATLIVYRVGLFLT
jgi:ferrous iron transport protein B